MSSKSFYKFQPFIGLLRKVFSIFPTPLLKILWSLFNSGDSNVSLLVRYLVLCSRVKQCGDNVFVGPNVSIRGFDKLTIGNNVSIHHCCYIDAKGGVNIGNEVSIAHQSSVLSFEHTWNDNHCPIKYNPLSFGKVVIKDDVWVGAGVRILSGATIESRTILGANTVVKGSLQGCSIYVGAPARLVKKI
ncbi:acyltransferase [Vibrio astriarenae]